MSRTWWSGLAAFELPVSCAGKDHRARWAEGELRALDHPDAERERALAALGADPYPCLQLLDAWNRHTDDLDVLLLAGRGPGDLLGRDEEDAVPSFSTVQASSFPARPARATGWTSYSPLAHARHMPPRYRHGYDERAEVERLLLLGRGLPERLVATVVATWADRIERDDERVRAALPALRAALYGRLRVTVATWLGAPTTVDLDLIAASAHPEVSGSRAGLRFTLPFSWLRDVWGKGLAITLGMLCLAVDQPDDGEWRLVAVAPPGPELAPPRRIVARVTATDGLRT